MLHVAKALRLFHLSSHFSQLMHTTRHDTAQSICIHTHPFVHFRFVLFFVYFHLVIFDWVWMCVCASVSLVIQPTIRMAEISIFRCFPFFSPSSSYSSFGTSFSLTLANDSFPFAHSLYGICVLLEAFVVAQSVSCEWNKWKFLFTYIFEWLRIKMWIIEMKHKTACRHSLQVKSFWRRSSRSILSSFLLGKPMLLRKRRFF